MSEGQAKFRSDLLVSSQKASGEIWFVIKDPATERFFRLRQPEYFIASGLDGATSLEALGQKVQEKFGARPSQEALEGFVRSLARSGLLEQTRPAPGATSQRVSRAGGSFLYLRLKAFDPDRLFDRVAGKLGFFFTPAFLAISAAAILLALGVSVANWSEMRHQLPRLYRLESLLLAWVAILCVTTAHEFAHGLTCKHFGGKVNEVGFLLIYFLPTFYCNVSDAWLFPEKSKRLWVTFAGAYFELLLWGMATLAWRVTDPTTALSDVALVVMATSAMKTVFNLNPLIKLDGYYLLSDYLEIPNLRQRSFHYLRAQLRRLCGAAREAITEATRRERRVYLGYGLLAGTYSFALLGGIASRTGSFLTRHYQGWGLVVFGALLFVVFRNQLKRAMPEPPAFFRRVREILGSMNRRARVLTLLGVVLTVLFLGRMELKVSGEFRFLPVQNADVRAEVDGAIEQVYVDEGDVVKTGEAIVRLADRDLAAEIQKTNAQINEKRAKLSMLKTGPRREEIELVRKQVETARTRQEYASKRYEEAKRLHAEQLSRARSSAEKAGERLKYARNDLERTKVLFDERLSSKKQVDEAQEQLAIREKELEEAEADQKMVLEDELAGDRRVLAVTEKELEEAEGRLKMVLAGSRPEEIEANEAEIARLEIERRYLEERLGRVRVMSPISGVIATPKLKEKVGQRVSKGDLIAKVYELDAVTAEIAIPENELADVRAGQKVVVKARAYPGESFSGKVTAIAPTATKGEVEGAGKTILVTTQLANDAHLLKPEMTGNAKIYCGKRSILHLLTRRFARYIRVEFWSWW